MVKNAKEIKNKKIVLDETITLQWIEDSDHDPLMLLRDQDKAKFLLNLRNILNSED